MNIQEKIIKQIKNKTKGSKIIRLSHTVEECLEETSFPLPHEIWYKYPTPSEKKIVKILEKKGIKALRPFPDTHCDRIYRYDHLIWKMMADGYLRKKDLKPIFFCYKTSTNLEEVCLEYKFKNLMPSYKLFKDLQNKNTLQKFGLKPGQGLIPFIQANIQKKSYAEIKKILGNKFVIQYSYRSTGWNTAGGLDTFFVLNKKDFEKIKKKNNNSIAKIAKYIKGKSGTIYGITNSKGTIVLEPTLLLSGIKEITDHQQLYCGVDFELTKTIPKESLQKLNLIVKKIGDTIYQQKYLGQFNADFIIEDKTGEVYINEINPRFGGSYLILNKILENKKLITPITIHLASTLNCLTDDFNIEEYEKSIRGSINGSMLIFYPENDCQLKKTPKMGLYKYENNKIKFIKTTLNINELNKPNHFYVYQNYPLKRNYYLTSVIGLCKILFNDSAVLSNSKSLKEKHKKIIKSLKRQFEFTKLDTYDSSVPYKIKNS